MKLNDRSFAFRLVLSLAAAVCWSEPLRAETEQENWCFLMESEATSNAGNVSAEEAKEDDRDIVKKIPGVRPPRADEVGPKDGSALPTFRPSGVETQTIPPLPGLPLDTSFDSVGWIPQGPSPIRNGGSDIPAINPTDPPNPSTGAVQAIAPHPTNQNILYIGTVNGGVWRTDNALAAFPRWKPLMDDQLSLSIGGLALDPNDASGNTLVAGIGRRSSQAKLGGAHKGLLRTTDGGTTWTSLGVTALAGCSIYNLTVRGNVILAAVPETDGGAALPGLYRSTDGGATFTNRSGATGSGLAAGGIDHLVADSSNSSRYYLFRDFGGVYRSDDSGATWTGIPAYAGLTGISFKDNVVAVGNDGTLYFAENQSSARVFRSTDHGVTVTEMDQVAVGANDLHNSFVVDPTNSNLIYFGGESGSGAGKLMRGDASKPKGSQWTSISSASSGGGTGPHTDSRAMVFTAGNRLIEADDGGAYELAIANVGIGGDGLNGGSKWRPLLGNLQDGEMHSVAYDTVARTPFGGMQDNSSVKVATTGIPTWDRFLGGDGGDAVGDSLAFPNQTLRYSSVQYMTNLVANRFDANNNQLNDTGVPTTLVGPGTPIVRGETGNMPFYTSFATNPIAGGRLIIGGKANTYESTDQGNTVTQIDTFGANSLAKIAYGGRFNGFDAPDVLFFGSGNTIRFRAVSGGSMRGLTYPDQNVQGIVFDPANWTQAYIVGTSTVYLANDIASNGTGGLTNLTGNLTGVGTFHTIDFLTLPSGNALMVGTDLGAYIMRLSAPGVWKTLGNNLPHAPVYDSQFDAAGQVLVISTLGRGTWLYDFKPTKATSQYGETFQAFSDGTSSFPARTGELFSNNLGAAGGARIVDDNVRNLQFTFYNNTFTRSVFRLPDLDPGKAVGAFSAKWNGVIYGDPSTMADGVSFNFGPLGGITQTAFTDTTYNTEDGFNAGLTVSIRTYSGNTPGYYVRVNGAVVPGGFVSKAPSAWGQFNGTQHFFEVDWRNDAGLTLKVDGVAIFTNLPTPGYFPAAGDRFVFGARCGASTEAIYLDNIAVFTGGILAPVTGVSPYYFSSQNTFNPAETADKAFDGNITTKWLALDYTGYIGASLSSPKTIRLYTLTNGNDTPARDLAQWDFQTGNDGVLWSQHGAQAAQFFSNRGETRAFVVANPAATSKFRMLISANHGDNYMQLAEFQPWEFIPVPMRLAVTNSLDSGAGSLRKAVADAAPFTGAVITIDTSLAGQTLNVTGGPIVLNTPNGVTINAPAIPGVGGVTLNSNNNGRIFNVQPSANVTLTNLTLTGGNVTGSFPNSYGGAMFNQGATTILNCTLAGNRASVAGGAVYNGGGTLTITGCTFSGNSAQYGGAVQNEGNMIVTSSTFAGNTASNQGGAISAPFTRPVSLTQTTISTNSAATGGGIYGDGFTIINSIVAGNTAPTDPNFSGSLTTGGRNILIGDPLLAPLDNYGGFTKTMALQPGSPARDSALGSTATSDQRGYPIVGPQDVGAYEAGTLDNYNAYIWETLPASSTVAQHATTFDFDGDGVSNLDEFRAGTNAADATSYFHVTQFSRSGSNVSITFPTVLGRNYTVEYATALNATTVWTQLPGTFAGTGNPLTITPDVTGFTQYFLRVRVGP